MKSLVNKRGSKYYSKTFKSVDPTNLGLNRLSLKILEELNEVPSYPNELAKKLKVHEQKVYYHINKLLEKGLIEVDREEEKQGAVCRYFKPTAQVFGIELHGKETLSKKAKEENLRRFLEEFISPGIFDGSIVVGSPLQHGPHLTSSRDGHYAIHLGLFLGNYCTIKNRFTVKLDTETKSEKSLKRNMLLVGGPITNIITNDINEKLKVRFIWDNPWSKKTCIYSEITKKKYSDEPIGLIAKIKNPSDKTKSIIILAGLQFNGTKACVMALTDHHEKILKDYKPNKDFYRVIKGLDRDGDGKIDDIKVLE
jgi:DNA-binding transcriptional ArsR family regulator